MSYRAALPLSIALSLGGCVAPSVPRLDFTDMTLPRFEIFRYGVEDTSIPTEPYQLTATDTFAIKSELNAAYRNERVLRFGPISARRARDLSLVVCGLVDVPQTSGVYAGMRLFDGIARPRPDGSLAFEPHRIAGRNAASMDVYIGCRDAGVI